MIAAYHFNADYPKYRGGSGYHLPIQRLFFHSLLKADLRGQHFKLYADDLLVSDFLTRAESREGLLRALLGYRIQGWNWLNHDAFSSAAVSARIYVVAVEGIGRSLCERLHLELGKDHGYLGALQVDEANQLHWLLYRQYLGARYRVFDGALRIFFHSSDPDSKDEGLIEYWRQLPFKAVVWEDLGHRATIIDDTDTFENAERKARLTEYLSEHLVRLADDILLRIEDLDEALSDQLYTALRGFQLFETNEDLAQSALSCRRFLTTLADCLYPPRDEPVNGRKVGKEQYINRLWAYVSESLQGDQKDAVISQLQDLGNRITAVNQAANAGLHHKIARAECERLISGLIVTAYDVISLREPPKEARSREVSLEDALRWLGIDREKQ